MELLSLSWGERYKEYKVTSKLEAPILDPELWGAQNSLATCGYCSEGGNVIGPSLAHNCSINSSALIRMKPWNLYINIQQVASSTMLFHDLYVRHLRSLSEIVPFPPPFSTNLPPESGNVVLARLLEDISLILSDRSSATSCRRWTSADRPCGRQTIHGRMVERTFFMKHIRISCIQKGLWQEYPIFLLLTIHEEKYLM